MTDANSLPFVYRPLRPLANDIRILTIHRAPDSTRGLLVYKLEHVSLSSASNYVALSYCWGAHYGRIPLHIEDSVIHITPSLANALVVLWRRGCSRIWADAICINQEDQEERSLQVLRMAAVYRSANAVIAWLGEADEPSLTGFQYLVDKCRALPSSSKTLRSLAEKNQSVGIPLKDPTSKHIKSKLKTARWEALGRLLALPYWGRVWIIQELAMANTLQIIWGSSPLNFSDIVRLVKVYEILLMGEFIEEGVPVKLRRQITSLAKFQKFQKKLTPVPLLQALRMSAFAESSDVRDKVYGLLGLTYEGSIVFPAPSYARSIEHISTDTTLRLARLHGSLDHIVFRATPPDRTWYINWFHHGPWTEIRLLSYLEGKSRFWDGGTVTKWKAGGSAFCMPFRKGSHLEVRGYVIDTIHSSSATLDESKSTGDNQEPSTDSQGDQGGPLVEMLDDNLFWSFCVGARSSTNSPPKASLSDQQGFYYGLRSSLSKKQNRKTAFSDSHLRRLKAVRNWLSHPTTLAFRIHGRSLKKVLKKERTSRWNLSSKSRCEHTTTLTVYNSLEMGMRIGVTAKGKIGWFTKHARPGDQIAIIEGCSVPVVLRRDESCGMYEVVGDSIINGFMHGEGAKKLRDPRLSRITLY